MRFKLRLLAILLPAVFLLDQITKWWIVRTVPQDGSVPVIPGLFDIVHTRNPGAAFGFMAGMPDSLRNPFFFSVSSVALALILFYFFRLRSERTSIYVALILILAGACGNLWDRITLGEVVDFLSFHWHHEGVRWRLGPMKIAFRLEWPAFNVADAAISVAAIWLIVSTLLPQRRRD